MDGSVTKAEGRNPNEPGDQPASPGLRCHFRCGRHAHRVLALGRTHLMEMDARGSRNRPGCRPGECGVGANPGRSGNWGRWGNWISYDYFYYVIR